MNFLVRSPNKTMGTTYTNNVHRVGRGGVGEKLRRIKFLGVVIIYGIITLTHTYQFENL